MSEGVRDMAFDTWGQLCKAARESEQGAVLAEPCQEFMKRVLPELDNNNRIQMLSRPGPMALRLVSKGRSQDPEQGAGKPQRMQEQFMD